MAKHLQQTIKAIVRPGDRSGFVAECVEVAVVTQGKERPTLVVTMEIDPDYAEAS